MTDQDGTLEPPAEVAFVGLGKMGLPMAGRLLAAGYRVTGCDLAEPALRAFAAAGGQTASHVRDAAERAAAIVTMLPDGKAVQTALLGPDGLSGRAAAGAVVIEMSSSSPIDTRALGERLGALGIGLVDAPVSGGVRKAQDGTLAIMAGGDPGLVARVRPLLEHLGGSIFETGPLGSGHAMKALNNYVSAAGLVAAAEALLVGRTFGLDPGLMVDVLNASTGRNNSTENKFKQFVLSGSFASGFALALMAKDLGTADDLARHLGVHAPLSECCRALWTEALGVLGPEADHTEIYRYLAAGASDAGAPVET